MHSDHPVGEKVAASLSTGSVAMSQKCANTSSVAGAPDSTLATTSPSGDVPAEDELSAPAPDKQESAQHDCFHRSNEVGDVAKGDRHEATEGASKRSGGVETAASEGADNDGDNNDVGGSSLEAEDGAYAAEYRSLLFRVAELEAQEEQRARRSCFALRMAQREAKLMEEVAAQQQAFLALGASPASRLQDGRVSKDSTNASHTSALPEKTSVAGSRPSAEDVAAAVAKDDRLACLAHLMERAQVQYRRCTEAAGLLRSHAGALRAATERQEKLQVDTKQLLFDLNREAGLDNCEPTLTAKELHDEIPPAQPMIAPMTPSPTIDLWHRHTTDLTTLGGTLAKVHTLFRDPECRTHMSVIATALAEIGRQCQSLLQELQALTEAELQIEADLRQRRAHALEWSLYAAHAQQAREMQDLYSPATLAEMRTMGLRKVLLRRRQELQNALTLVFLHHAGRSGGGGGGAPLKGRHVSVERMKLVTDTCARREGLRDRLWRELLYLKKCARRVLGVAWVSQGEATALASLSPTADGKGYSRTLEALLEKNLCLASYDSLAQLISRVAGASNMKDEPSDCAKADLGGRNGDVEEREEVLNESAGLTLSPHSQSLTPATPLPTRVQVLSLLEALQTRANSLVSLLSENAKHWQRTQDVLLEAELCAGSSEDGWCRAVELLLGQCTNTDTAELFVGGQQEKDPDKHLSRTSPLLMQEQMILDSLHTSQAAIVDAINAAIARVHAEYTAPLEKEKEAVAFLIRILQLSDEAGASERHSGGTCNSATPRSHTTPALECAMQLMKSTDDFSLKNDGTGSSMTTSEANKVFPLPQVHLPQLPLRVDAVQETLHALSIKWKDSLAAETAATRTKVVQTQAKLDQYAQYSMAEVPSLLEKAQSEASALRERITECTTRNSRAASLAAQLEEQRSMLTNCSTTARHKLMAAVKQAQQEVASLKVQVAHLEVLKDLSANESLHRVEILEAEVAAWSSHIRDHRTGLQDEVHDSNTSVGSIHEHYDRVAEQDVAEESRNPAVNEETEDQSPIISVQPEDEVEGSETLREEEAESDAGIDNVGNMGDEEQFLAVDPVQDDELDVNEAGEDAASEAEASLSASLEGSGGDATGSDQEPVGAGAGTEENPPLSRPHNAIADEEDASEWIGTVEGVSSSAVASEGGQRNARRELDESQEQNAPREELSLISGGDTKMSAEATPQLETISKEGRGQVPLHPSEQHQVQPPPRQHQHQQPSILGDSVLGQGEVGQLPPVFASVAGNPFTNAASPPIFPTVPLSRPVFEDNPFYSGFGFEEE